MKNEIYVASSWKNKYFDAVIEALEKEGLEPYNFRNPESNFSWKDVDPNSKNWDFNTYIEILYSNTLALDGFRKDFAAMKMARAFLLVLPAGRSANLEAGWAIGSGKPTCVLMLGENEPDLMYKMADYITNEIHYAVKYLKDILK